MVTCVCSITIVGLACRLNVLRGDGKQITSTPEVGQFNAVEVSLPISVSITVSDGSKPSIELSGYENILAHIKTKIKGNTLKIYTDLNETWTLGNNEKISAKINLPSLVQVGTSGAADVQIHGNISGKSFGMDLSGASDVSIDNINVDEFETQGSGASTIEIKGGNVKHAVFQVSGAGKIKAYPLAANSVDVQISGAGSGQVTATEKLFARISGAGSITYKGHPVVDQDVSGAGSISRVE